MLFFNHLRHALSFYGRFAWLCGSYSPQNYKKQLETAKQDYKKGRVRLTYYRLISSVAFPGTEVALILF